MCSSSSRGKLVCNLKRGKASLRYGSGTEKRDQGHRAESKENKKEPGQQGELTTAAKQTKNKKNKKSCFF